MIILMVARDNEGRRGFTAWILCVTGVRLLLRHVVRQSSVYHFGVSMAQ